MEGEVAPDSSRQGSGDVGWADEPAHHRDRVVALGDHGDYGTRNGVLGQFFIEGFADVLGVMFADEFVVDAHELQCDEFQTLSLDAGKHFADKAAL
ncbi:MAG: hypothetical protein A2Z99_03295 [Treponema sp. GWB1_62_6]|nr:MAG: hypothetical protein A2Z99_03295 [Treponema sp. GWB1_62_6]